MYVDRVKKITFSVDERLIDAALQRARAERTTLDEAFRRWLLDYASHSPQRESFDEVLTRLRGQLIVGSRVARDDMNAR